MNEYPQVEDFYADSVRTLDDLIEQLQEIRDDHGGETPVRVAYQPSYPLQGRLSTLAVTNDRDTGRPTLFITTGGGDYAPRAVFGG